MTRERRVRPLLLLGITAVVLMGCGMVFPGSAGQALGVIGRLCLAGTVIGLIPAFLRLGGNAFAGHAAATRLDPATVDAQLPVAAHSIIAHINEQLAAGIAERVPDEPLSESSFTLDEVGRRYLPETIAAYLTIPSAQRASHAEELLAQLRLLDGAVTKIRAGSLPDGAAALAVNGRFLADRFAGR